MMIIEIKKGDISDFFDSAKETTREIDTGRKITRKNTIWVESTDLMKLLKTERTMLDEYLRGGKSIIFADLLNLFLQNITDYSFNSCILLYSLDLQSGM